jgi:hypothetical protein
MTDLARKTIEVAATQVGVREHGRNRGPEIDSYWKDCGMEAGGLSLPPVGSPKAWCAVFVCAMVRRACDALGIPVPIHLTAGVFTLDEKAPVYMRSSIPVAGSIFILNGHRHTGLVVEDWTGALISTTEGNTSPDGSVEGDGVYRRTRRRSELLCFIDLNREPIPASAR